MIVDLIADSEINGKSFTISFSQSITFSKPLKKKETNRSQQTIKYHATHQIFNSEQKESHTTKTLSFKFPSIREKIKKNEMEEKPAVSATEALGTKY